MARFVSKQFPSLVIASFRAPQEPAVAFKDGVLDVDEALEKKHSGLTAYLETLTGVGVSVVGSEGVAESGPLPEPESESESESGVLSDIVAEDSPAVADSVPVLVSRPSDSAARPLWVAYAAALGVDAEGLTRAQIREACAAKEADDETR